VNGNIQGCSHGLDFAINPIAVNRAKTVFHELGHIVLGHTLPSTIEEYRAHRGVAEFQAEAAAYLSMNELGQLDEDTAIASRGYIQHWLRNEQPPERAIQQVFRATDAILKAGRAA
jgi:antirestriction protein ArdC